MRVLLVEDEAGLAATLKLGLAREGWAVDVADNGIDGVWAATERHYDVIVLDLMLPGLNGYQVCEQLRADKVWTPILILTAKDGDYDQAEAFDTGADDYLVKPFSLVVLTARLRALVRRGAPERPAVLSAGDLTLDPARRVVARAGSEIAVTPREFSVLEHLMRHAGSVVTKTEVLESVWDENYDGDSNIVEVYVGYLRRKIDLPFGRSSLRTVRGAGYLLASDGG
ncbi:response regulator transcription factor [Cryptosporangium sp. NPDC051539]|uniref:response regulator transcription factor n=1 Tax=Cryptosporangium sp. NPDC051539 TaxID=3363962 RepID=UPI00378EAC82